MNIKEPNINFTRPVFSEVDSYPTLPTVEFTEDDWNTIHLGCCIDSTFYSYKVRGNNYGTFWVPKCFVRLLNNSMDF